MRACLGAAVAAAIADPAGVTLLADPSVDDEQIQRFMQYLEVKASLIPAPAAPSLDELPATISVPAQRGDDDRAHILVLPSAPQDLAADADQPRSPVF
jgi:hypothetical protein